MRISKRERFERKFVRHPSGCWVWTAACDKQWGYGFFGVSAGRCRKAHRVAWEIYRGPIPEGMQVLHHCDNPPCVNPDHLFLGDNAANVADRVRKGRTAPPLVSNRRLSWSDVEKIRNDLRPVKVIAAEHGVILSTIYRVLRGETWR